VTKFVVAECERCGGKWLVGRKHDPDTLQGVCGDCNGDTDVERPLTFHYAGQVALGYPDLPKKWVAS
jgi:hypothetical protein